MAIKNLIARGIGFSPGSVKFMPTLGLSTAADITPGVGGMFFDRIELFSGGADRVSGFTGGSDTMQGFTGGADRMESD